MNRRKAAAPLTEPLLSDNNTEANKDLPVARAPRKATAVPNNHNNNTASLPVAGRPRTATAKPKATTTASATNALPVATQPRTATARANNAAQPRAANNNNNNATATATATAATTATAPVPVAQPEEVPKTGSELEQMLHSWSLSEEVPVTKQKSMCARGVCRRTLWLAFYLFLAQIAACSLFCLHWEWIYRMFTCSRYDESTWDHLDPDGNPICLPYPSTCTPMQLSVILDMFAANVVIIIYWIIGEELREKFNRSISFAPRWKGRQWQKTLNKRNRDTGIQPPDHALKLKQSKNNKKAELENNWNSNQMELKWYGLHIPNPLYEF